MASIGGFLRMFDGKPDRLLRRLRLLDFHEQKPVRDWKASITTDSSWGGSSEASFGLEEKSGRTIGVFQGNISKKGNLEAQKLGFAALTLERGDGAMMNCDEYATLVIRAQPDNGRWAVTLRNANFLAPELAYQGFFKAKNCQKISSLILDFASFLPTRAGHLTELDNVLDIPRFSGLSFALADRDYEGPFRLEIDSIFATNESPDEAAKPIPSSEFDDEHSVSFDGDDDDDHVKK